ncbi:unnamed protein product [Cladocopium goreaui]|uniref:Uncharacterized protein n=1 Tax=Cladocopium goreaui TaxID=2562237 RepID=A0A9P1GF59_9DINO|nr:unnamed protein product [Cladocopium goreaui]
MPSIVIGARDEDDEESPVFAAPPEPPVPVPSLRVLFVDDDVLNSSPDPRAMRLDDEPCRVLQSLLVRTDAKMVLTSHWRRHKAYVLEVLGNYGVLPKREVDTTPFNADTSRRDLEILQWLNTHRQEVAAWFVLDSQTLLQHPGPAARLEGHVRQVQGSLSAADTAAAEAVLGTAVPTPLDGLKMDEELVFKMQDVMMLLSSSPQFHPPPRATENSSAASEFDRLLQEAKQRFR